MVSGNNKQKGNALCAHSPFAMVCLNMRFKHAFSVSRCSNHIVGAKQETLILNTCVLLSGGGVEFFDRTLEDPIYSTITSSANSQPPKLLGSA